MWVRKMARKTMIRRMPNSDHFTNVEEAMPALDVLADVHLAGLIVVIVAGHAESPERTGRTIAKAALRTTSNAAPR